jgi:hypothetical protein
MPSLTKQTDRGLTSPDFMSLETTISPFSTVYVSPHSSADLEYRARIFKLLRSPRINYNWEPIPPAYVAKRTGTTTLFVVPASQVMESIPWNRSLGSLNV